MSLSIIILAAGQGTRMKSSVPKVLHELAGKPLVQHVIDTATSLEPSDIHLVYGHGADQLKATITSPLNWVLQAEQLGTGHAVQQVRNDLPAEGVTLILYGDVPLVTSDTLRSLIGVAETNTIAVLSVKLDEPGGYGRIVRDENGKFIAIVEHKDATDEQRKIAEINSGIMAIQTDKLHEWLGSLTNNNAQAEYYLTDLVAIAVNDQAPVEAILANSAEEVEGINDRVQLAKLERYFQRQQATNLMLSGVTLLDPERIDVRGNVRIGQDSSIDIDVIIEGDVKIGNNCRIGSHVVLKDCTLANNVVIKSHTVVEGASIGDDCSIGPFARIRPGANFVADVHIGNFVEVKNSRLEKGVKAGHLSYLGDAEIGERVNVGAGTITCNYDGANKHKTVIEADVFVGSDTQLVAPVIVGKGTTIAAGTTVTQNVSDNCLVISRTKQREIANWKRPVKNK
ncbi:MAG: bifunctional UDP-N-acetylglucosamine diphosphorylase/glucosamine-1-phosphate N-acetyltransferase GlmU [Enterobacterales bacterium]|nr:bifunctional UDP-N-acetylglucosamine diphosphorylase/glucosamine-1-phosphate N-acetyltransferase GlmU [Enterobacterales bacterium]